MGKVKAFFRSRTKVLCVLAFLAASVVIYYFSADSRIHAVSISGNYYFTSREVYNLAGIDADTRIWVPSFVLENRLESDPLIESAKVTKDGQDISIEIQEKLVIGYYVSDGANYMFTRDGESIEITDLANLKNAIHFPLIVDLSDEVLQRIAREFQKYPDYLTREVLEKIAEILPWSQSYDANMVKLIMQDGNTVYSEIESLHMISNYQAMLPSLQGEDVCLMLDGENQTIDKMACEYFTMSSEERDAYRYGIKTQLQNIDTQQAAKEQAQAQAEADAKAKAEAEAKAKAEEEAKAQENASSDEASEQSVSENPEESGESQ